MNKKIPLMLSLLLIVVLGLVPLVSTAQSVPRAGRTIPL